MREIPIEKSDGDKPSGIAHLARRLFPSISQYENILLYQAAKTAFTGKLQAKEASNIVSLLCWLLPSITSRPLDISPFSSPKPGPTNMLEMVRQAYELESVQRDQVLEVIRRIKNLLKPIADNLLEFEGKQQKFEFEQNKENSEIWMELPEEEWQGIQEQIAKDKQCTWYEEHKEGIELIWYEEIPGTEQQDAQHEEHQEEVVEVSGDGIIVDRDTIWKRSKPKLEGDIKATADRLQLLCEVIWLCKYLANIAYGMRHWQLFEAKSNEQRSTESSERSTKRSTSDNDHEDYQTRPGENEETLRQLLNDEIKSINNAIFGKSYPEQIAKMLEYYETCKPSSQKVPEQTSNASLSNTLFQIRKLLRKG
jgi:hypothetical protein